MATTVARIPTSFRFQSTLLDELKAKAKESNRSLNNYVESLLISILHPAKPKDLTEGICQGLREVKMMQEGKIKELSMDDLLDEL